MTLIEFSEDWSLEWIIDHSLAMLHNVPRMFTKNLLKSPFALVMVLPRVVLKLKIELELSVLGESLSS